MSEEVNYNFEDVELQSTRNTPYIKLLKNEGLIEVKGMSVPENTNEFYWSFNRWLMEYATQPSDHTTVNLAFTYLNSASSVVVTRMMLLLDNMMSSKHKLSINWTFEKDDPDMKELIEHCNDSAKVNINLIPVDRID